MVQYNNKIIDVCEVGSILSTFCNFMRILTSFAIVLEFLIGFRKSSGLLMHKKCYFRNTELTSRISTLSEKQFLFPEFWKDLA